MRQINPDALAIASKLDDSKPSATRPLACVPVLLKDNIATGDRQPTTAGSPALDGAHARGDVTLVKFLREAAGAKIENLDAKTRELIAVAVSIALACDGCISSKSQKTMNSLVQN